MDIVISLAILLFSAIVHEVSHGLMAEKLGDSTARDEGRITLNPIVHIDPFGSILLPVLLLLANSPVIFGAAKPVPVNFNNLKNPKRDMALVSLAGPFSNFILAAIFALIIRLGLANEIAHDILIQAIVINILLGVFNLIPIPPLDGSKILASFAPDRLMHWILSMEQFGFILVFVFLWSGFFSHIFVPALLFFWQIFGLPVADLFSAFGG